jgi:hypothetical protein
MGAAAIHFAAAPGHVSEYLLYGLFFSCLGVAQVGLAVAIYLARNRRLYAGALGATLAVIGLWLTSRTSGLPIAPLSWHPEAIAFPDFAATLLEAMTCVLFILRLRRRPPKRRGVVRVALTTLPAALFAPLMAAGGVGSFLNPMPVAFNAAPAIPGHASIPVPELIPRQAMNPSEFHVDRQRGQQRRPPSLGL